MGISDIQNSTSVDLRLLSVHDPDAYKLEISRRENVFLNNGFTPQQLQKMYKDNRALVKTDNLTDTLDVFTEIGVPDPRGVIVDHCDCILKPREYLMDRISWLEEMGVRNVPKLIGKYGAIISVDKEIFENRMKWLSDKGFSDPIAVVLALPQIIYLRETYIENNIVWLEKNGFTNPIQFLNKYPRLIAYDMKNSINRKMRLYRKLSQNWNSEFPLVSAMRKNLNLFSSKEDKIYVLARLLGGMYDDGSEIDPTVVNTLSKRTLEDVLLTFYSVEDPADIVDFHRELRRQIKSAMSRDEKREKLYRLFQKDPEDEILRRYFRGYPLKDNRSLSEH